MPLINLPKIGEGYRKRKAIVELRWCQEPGCGKEYYGHPITKYCEYHRDLANRARKRYITVDPGKDNTIFKHKFTTSVNMEFVCHTCGASFHVMVLPKQFIYPKYCELHRSKYKREIYLKEKKC